MLMKFSLPSDAAATSSSLHTDKMENAQVHTHGPADADMNTAVYGMHSVRKLRDTCAPQTRVPAGPSHTKLGVPENTQSHVSHIRG
ncbi:hypothetical protein H920_08356 [Fukomys damarensis]|uniref:Uncharacterized protein n=1 Tax=Fukomys damarensis TaxID=885580 RepID=A0A091DID8_FUKDA|nr:hypothetical protein H920_08356 [Fukomys damarensis]